MTVTKAKSLPTSRELRRFTVDEYEAMVAAGIFQGDERVELIRGLVVKMSGIDPPHAWSVNLLNEVLVTRLAGRAYVAVQNPIRLGDSMPQPDVAVMRRDVARTMHPRPGDIHLVIEVADTSLRSDLTEKVPLYAENLIAELWVVDVRGARVLVFRDPDGGGHRREASFGRGESITLLAYPDVRVTVEEILGATE